ncbi:MAG: putative lipid II flippase FtsW [Melioribacteraceae bacterium]|nr:putative lipid II flippase FtsW [Melioribacteraceae bacterium]
MIKGSIRVIILFTGILILLGGIIVFTASSTISAEKFDSLYSLFKLHLVKMIFSIIGMSFFAILVPYQKLKKYSKYLLMGIVVVLVLTFLIMPSVKGASRWINLGFMKLQPSEIAKLFLIIHLAHFLERKGEGIKDFKNGFALALFWIFLISTLIFLQPNFSSAIIIGFISFAILFVGDAKKSHVFGTIATVATPLVTVMMFVQHTRERIIGFVKSFLEGGDPNIQVYQAKVALGSGGWLGRGIGHSRQSDLFLPESYGDFIFSILGEEAGLAGAIAVLTLYLAIFLCGLYIAKKTNDKFGQLLAFGISFNILITAFINAAVVAGIVPTTGITLPFISYGGTSIIMFAISVGILINIGNQAASTGEMKLAQY